MMFFILFLKKYKLHLMLAFCFLFFHAMGYRSGSLKMEHYYQQILLKQAQEHELKQQSWLKQAEQINKQQLDWQKQTQIQTIELKKEIQNVIAKDRANGTGDCTFGDHSLQHYRKSLGYD